MWPELRALLRELFRLAVGLGLDRVEAWRNTCLEALARERQRLFEVLALLCLGLTLLALGLGGLLLLAWWSMPEAWRVPVMALALLLLTATGLGALQRARRRATRD